MYFNSILFALFLPIVFVLYWFVFSKNKTSQNSLLLVASYFFYACWDWRFLFLLLFSTALDFYSGHKIENSTTKNLKKRWFYTSIGINLGFLGVFKYYNFFTQSFSDLLHIFGVQSHPIVLNIILPVGISFYTFHGLSYVIDIYKNKIKPESNFINYSLFVSYFPLLVAGPIERATHLLPQIKIKRTFRFEKAKQGVYQILWGLLKKIVIADSCAQYSNVIFDNYEQLNSLSLLVGAVSFAFQIYGDFSGYSDIAIGTSKLFGIELLQNFNYPYFSRDIAEFWRRWHISLSSWFRDYLYIPLGGSKVKKCTQIRNVFIIFLVSGFWHGANWTFLFWGLLNALYILPLIVFDKNRENLSPIALKVDYNGFKTLLKIVFTFGLTTFAWIFFRANSISQAVSYCYRMFTDLHFGIQQFAIDRYSLEILILIAFFVLFEWFHKYKPEPISGKMEWLKTIFILIIILLFGVFHEYKQFIYFQF